MHIPNPRVNGVREHLERAKFFAALAASENDAVAKYRLALAALYSCRALVELMLEAAEKQQVTQFNAADPKSSRDSLEAHVSRKLKHYHLIESIRIHDFHRFGLIPPIPSQRSVFVGGPIKLTAHGGSAAVATTTSGLLTSTTGNSRVRLQRPLQLEDGCVFDEELGAFVSIERVVADFLHNVPTVVTEFESLVA